MKRVVVIGTSGGGKTTLAQEIAVRLKLPHTELDSLHHEPGWQEAELDVFRARVDVVTSGVVWVVDGNYSKVRDLVWPRADTLIWLDYPPHVFLPRLFWRTVKRIVTRENLWGTGNRETFQAQFLSRDSLFVWAWNSSKRRKTTYPHAFAQPEHAHLTIHHFTSPRQTREFMSKLDAQS